MGGELLRAIPQPAATRMRRLFSYLLDVTSFFLALYIVHMLSGFFIVAS